MISAATFVLVWLIVNTITTAWQIVAKPIEVKVKDPFYAVIAVTYTLFMFVAALVILL